MGVLQDFERRLEGAVEGFFARAFRSGLQPIEMAKAIQRYAEDTQHVTADGVVVPNVYRFTISTKDTDRLETFGDSLNRELAEVVTRTADEHGWLLRGPAIVRLESSDDVAYGRYELAGRVEVVEGAAPQREPARSAAGGRAEPAPARQQPAARGGLVARAPAVQVISGGDTDQYVTLTSRTVVGRLPSCDVSLTDGTVSREHAAFVKRGDSWWIIDLGSTNGTRVNGVNASEHPLTPGDRVHVGEAELEFVEG